MAQSDNREYSQEEGGDKNMAGGLFTNKNALLLMAGGALGALGLMALGKTGNKMRPAAVEAVKEGMAFKEWFATRFEKIKEDFEDIVAEGAYEHESEEAAEADLRSREDELLAKIEKMIDAKLANVKQVEKGD